MPRKKKNNVVLPVVIIVVVIIAVVVVIGSSNLFPKFASVGTCESAAVIVHAASYNPSSSTITVKIQNDGTTDLELETFVTPVTGDVQKLSTKVYLSSGATDTFTIPGIAQQPQEATWRDVNCGVADLAKF